MADYTIDELAHAAETTVRNVRAYQAKRLLPPPRREGRANVYTDVHLARLRLINRLLARGYSLGNIDEMLRAFERGDGVSDLLGLEQAIISPWSNELPSYMSTVELTELFGQPIPPRELLRAAKIGLIREDQGRLLVPSPRLLSVGAELVQAGIPFGVLLDQLEDLRDDVDRIAERFVHLIVEQVFNRYGEDKLPPAEERPGLAEFVYRVRPMAQIAVDVELARALEASIHNALGERLARIVESMERDGSAPLTPPAHDADAEPSI